MTGILTDDFLTMTWGNVKSNNAFKTQRCGLVTNSVDPGDDYVIDLLAARGLDATPERKECIDCPGSSCPLCGGEPPRKPGRGFEGPDAGAAREILSGVRENSVAQAVGRRARGPESPRAVVFVRTSAVPEEMVDIEISRAWTFTDKQRAVFDYVRENPGQSVDEIREGTEVSKSTVQRTLKKLIEYGVAERGEVGGVFRYILTENVPDDGVLDLSRV